MSFFRRARGAPLAPCARRPLCRARRRPGLGLAVPRRPLQALPRLQRKPRPQEEVETKKHLLLSPPMMLTSLGGAPGHVPVVTQAGSVPAGSSMMPSGRFDPGTGGGVTRSGTATGGFTESSIQ